jgi:anti-sigma B factor antagonist
MPEKPELARVLTTNADGVRIVTATGELDVATSGLLEQHLAKVTAGRASGLIVDLTGVIFIDSSSIHALFKAGARFRGPKPVLVVEPGFVRRVLDIVEIEHVFAIEASLAEAMKRVGAEPPTEPG